MNRSSKSIVEVALLALLAIAALLAATGSPSGDRGAGRPFPTEYFFLLDA